MELTMKNLKECFNGAISSGAQYIGIKFDTLGENTTFVKVISREHFTNHKLHVDMFYDNYLMHKHYTKKIVGFTYGDTFEDIEKDLIGK